MTDHWIPSKMADELRKAHAEKVKTREKALTRLGEVACEGTDARTDARMELTLLKRAGFNRFNT